MITYEVCFEVWDELQRVLEPRRKTTLLRQIACWFFEDFFSQFALLDLLKATSFTVVRRKHHEQFLSKKFLLPEISWKKMKNLEAKI